MKPLYTQLKEQQKNINNMKSYFINNAGWYRIGEFDYNNSATALISFAVRAGNNNNAGILSLIGVKGFNHASLEKIAYQELNPVKHFTKFRLVLKNYTLSYIEVYKNTETQAILNAKLSADINTALYDTAQEGNVPDGYSTIELEL